MGFTAQIDANIDGFRKSIDEATAKLKTFTNNISDNSAAIGAKFTAIGQRAAVMSAAFAAAGAASFKMAADFQDSVGASEQIFKGASKDVQDWANSLPTYYGIAKGEAMQYASTMGAMLQNIGGLTEKEAAKQSATLIELAGDLTAMFGGQTTDAIRALTGALKGNTSMLDNYGMGVNDAAVKAKALAMGLSDGTGEMNLQARQAATLALIMEQTGAAQGQAAREADGASGSMRQFSTAVKNLSTDIGTILLPVFTPVISAISNVVKAIGSASPAVKTAIVVFGGLAAAFAPVMLGIGKLITLLPVLKVGFAALTGPVGLVVAAVVAGVALIIANWESIKAYFTTGGGSGIFDELKNMVTYLKGFFVESFNYIKTTVSKIWSEFGVYIVGVFSTAIKQIKVVFEFLLNVIKSALKIIRGIFSLDFKLVLQGLTDLFYSAFKAIAQIALNALSGIASGIAGFFKMIGVDKWADSIQGFAERISSMSGKFANPIKVTTSAISEQKEEIKDTVIEVKDLDKTFSGATNKAGKLVETIKRIQIPDKLASLAVPKANLEYKLPDVDTTKFVNSVVGLKEQIEPVLLDISNSLSGFIGDFAETIGSAIGEGDFSNFGAKILDGVGKFAQSFGALVMSAGIAALNLQKLMVNPTTAIIAGAALIALGAAVSGAAKKMVKDSSASGFSGGARSNYSTSSSSGMGASELKGAYSDFNVTFKIGANELVGVLNTAEQRKKRL